MSRSVCIFAGVTFTYGADNDVAGTDRNTPRVSGTVG